MYKWKVCPIQGRQLKDVREEDIWGDFRICDTYRGGGGYDQFPKIAKRRGLTCKGDMGLQFVVQLYGCPLNCSYCYVTADGIRGEWETWTSLHLLGAYGRAFIARQPGVFHLMGGAPALYLNHWPELLDKFDSDEVIFHSDLMLVEGSYNLDALRRSNKGNALYAVNIKGTPKTFKQNTGRELNEELFWSNLDKVVESGINFYITITKPDFDTPAFMESIESRYPNRNVLEDSFYINLVNYEALK